jgi:hypothetical protein
MRILIFILFIISVSACGQRDRESSIKVAVEHQMELYPCSTLQDIYKNFFQDRFGPGHIISDTASAGEYLREELNSLISFSGVPYEPTGYMGNFYRVNLSVIKEGKVDYDTFFKTFIKSVSGFEPISVQEWKDEWGVINGVVYKMNLNLKHYSRDSLEIAHLLQEGKYVMHHSREFSEAYNPHYRIVRKEYFEKMLLPLINK